MLYYDADEGSHDGQHPWFSNLPSLHSVYQSYLLRVMETDCNKLFRSFSDHLVWFCSFGIIMGR